MQKSETTISRILWRGYRIPHLVAFLFLFEIIAGHTRAAETLWGCLLYASNDGQRSEVPTRLDAYSRRLSNAFGYSRLRLLGEGQTVVKTTDQNWLIFAGDIKVQFTSLSKTDDGKYLVGLELFQEEKSVIETQARVSQDSPLFIRGPEWRDGKIIIVVMVAS